MKYYQDGELLAERIVNTRDTTQTEPEYLRTPKDLARYLHDWDMLPAQELTAQDLAEVLALRRHLRAVFEAGDLAVAAALLNDLLAGVSVKPHIELLPDGGIELNVEVGEDLPLARRLGVEAALGLSAALQQYGIERLHVCQAAPCTDVFLDTSRNHTRRYCCPQCANRHNVAAHRLRQRAP